MQGAGGPEYRSGHEVREDFGGGRNAADRERNSFLNTLWAMDMLDAATRFR